MFSRAEATSANFQIAGAATEVLWKLVVNGEFDDQNITSLLQAPECILLTAEFLVRICNLLDLSKEPSVKSLRSTTERLLMLLSNKDFHTLAAMFVLDTFCSVSENSIALVARIPSCLQELVELLPKNEAKRDQVLSDKDKVANEVDQLIRTHAMMVIKKLARAKENFTHLNKLANRGLVQWLVMLLDEDDAKLACRCSHAAQAIGALAQSPELAVAFAEFPRCLERLARLLAESLQGGLQQSAVGAVVGLAINYQPCVYKHMLEAPGLVVGLVMLLSENLKDTCHLAAEAIACLTRSPELARAFAESPSCLERLDGLLAGKVNEGIKDAARSAITHLVLHEKNCVQEKMVAIPGMVERLVMLLSEDLQLTCTVPATAIARLAKSSELALAFAHYPSCLDRLGLLPENDEENSQLLVLRIIATLATQKENCDQMKKLPTEELEVTLMNVLSKDREDRCYWAATAISSLAQSTELALAFAQFPGCLERLVGLLDDNVKGRIQLAALTAIAVLAKNKENCDRMKELSPDVLVVKLVDLLSKDMEDRCMWAARAISSLAQSAKFALAFAQFPRCLQRLAKLLGENVEDRIQLAALRAITVLAENKENCDRLKELSAQVLVVKLVDLLTKDMQDRCYWAARAISSLAQSAELALAFAQFPGCLERLVELLGENVEDRIQLAALRAITILAENKENCDCMKELSAHVLVVKLVDLLTKDMQDRCYWAARAISSLAQSAELALAFAQFPGCLERLVELLGGNVEEGIRNVVLRGIATLVKNKENCDRMKEVLVVKLVDLLSKDMADRCYWAARAISSLAQSAELALAFAQFPGCLERLIELLDENMEEGIQIIVLKSIATLGKNTENCDHMKELSAEVLVVKLVGLLSMDRGRRCYWATTAISSLAESGKFALAFAQFPRCLERIVGLLGENVEDPIQLAALRAITVLAENKENCDRMKELSAQVLVVTLVDLLTKDMQDRCYWAARAISSLAQSAELALAFAQFPGCLERLVELLDENVEEGIQIVVLKSIATLAKNKENCDRMKEVLVVKLVDLLSKDMEDRCYWAARAISSLAQSAELALAFAQFPGCLERLVELLGGNVEEGIRNVVLRGIATLAKNKENCDRMKEVLVVKLVDLLSKDMEDGCYWAARAISSLAQSAELALAFAQFPGCLERLVELLDENVEEGIQIVVLKSIATLAKNKENCDRMKEVLVVKLVDLLSKDMEDRCYWAARAISSLAQSAELALAFAQFPGCLERLVELLGGNVEEGIRNVVLRGIATLAKNKENCDRMKEVLVVKLVDLLSKDMEDGCYWAARAISSLAQSAELALAFAQFPGCLERLVELLGGNVEEGIRNVVLRGIATLAKNKENFDRMKEVLVGKLVDLLSNDMEDRCYWAARAISSLAQSAEFSLAFAQFPGCLEGLVGLLQEDVQSNTQTSSTVAILRLSRTPSNVDSIIQHPTLVQRLARLLSEECGEEVKEVAVRIIRELICACRNNPDRASFLCTIEEIVKKARVTGPASAELFSYWSYGKAEMEDYEGAMIDINKGLELDGNSPFLFQERGVLRRLMGDNRLALADLNKSLEFDDDDYEVLKHRALVKYLLDDIEGAYADADRAIRVKPSRVESDSYHMDLCLGVRPVKFLSYSLK